MQLGTSITALVLKSPESTHCEKSTIVEEFLEAMANSYTVTSQPVHFAIRGHSFVRRLVQVCPPPRGILTSVRGIGGATVARMRAEVDALDADFQGIVFFQVGENDVSASNVPEDLVEGLLHLLDYLRWKRPGSRAVIGSLFPRVKPRNMTVSAYKRKIEEANRRLRRMLRRRLDATYWDHSLHMRMGTALLAKDGVHLTPKANAQFWLSIRKCMCRYV